MEKPLQFRLHHFFFLIFSLFLSVHESNQHNHLHHHHHQQQQQLSPQFQVLLQIQQQLNYPQYLSTLNETRNLCTSDPNPSLTIICYEDDDITQLHINGGGDIRVPPLPSSFSSERFFSTLSTLTTLKVLSLVNLGLWGPLPSNISTISSLEIFNISLNYFNGEIPKGVSSLRNLQAFNLDNNYFTGRIPIWLSSLSLPELSVLSLRNNSLTGSLPFSLSTLQNLRVLSLSNNNLSGEVPDLHSLTNLQVLDLGDNGFGPHFPTLHHKLVMLILRNNRFSFGIPANLSSFYRLRMLDISSNQFVGPFVLPILSLPLLSYIDISRNKFTGMFSENIPCSGELAYVNLSSNRFTGHLPTCLKPNNSSSRKRRVVVNYAGNCLSKSEQQQHQYSFCHNEALAVNIVPRKRAKATPGRRGVLASSLVCGIVGGFAICGAFFMVIRRKLYAKQNAKTPQPRLIMEKVSTANTIKLLSDARYISETMKLGPLGLPPYRTFSFEELMEATINFCESNVIGEGSHGKVYKGSLADGTLVAIKSLKMVRRHAIQSYRHQIELVSKLRHRHLVSAVGHCFDGFPDDSSVNTMFLVFEFVTNGTLRDCISGGLAGKKFPWKQRIASAIGVASGVQFLHTGIVPGIFSNNLRITDVLLDHDLVPKISNYNLPLLADDKRQVGTGVFPTDLKERNRVKNEDKNDVYDMGVIILEIIVGRAIMSQSAINVAKDLLQVSLTTDEVARRSIVDPAIHKECSDESLKTMMGICLRCLSNEPTDRPSVEDVLWNLQFAAQVQDSWRVEDSSSSTPGSPIMSPNPKQIER